MNVLVPSNSFSFTLYYYEFMTGATGKKVKCQHSFTYVFDDKVRKICHHNHSVMTEGLLLKMIQDLGRWWIQAFFVPNILIPRKSLLGELWRYIMLFTWHWAFSKVGQYLLTHFLKISFKWNFEIYTWYVWTNKMFSLIST